MIELLDAIQHPGFLSYRAEVYQCVLPLLRDEQLMRERVEDVIEGYISGDYDYYAPNADRIGKLEKIVPPHIQTLLSALKDKTDRQMQVQIAVEALGYLGSPKASALCQSLLSNTIAALNLPPIEPRLIMRSLDSLIQICILTPWAEEFERLNRN
jgi:hypothetical protein